VCCVCSSVSVTQIRGAEALSVVCQSVVCQSVVCQSLARALSREQTRRIANMSKWSVVHTYLSATRDFKSLGSPLTEEIRISNVWMFKLTRVAVWATGTPIHFREKLFEILGFPWAEVQNLRGLPWKLVRIFAVVIISSLISSTRCFRGHSPLVSLQDVTFVLCRHVTWI